MLVHTNTFETRIQDRMQVNLAQLYKIFGSSHILLHIYGYPIYKGQIASSVRQGVFHLFPFGMQEQGAM